MTLLINLGQRNWTKKQNYLHHKYFKFNSLKMKIKNSSCKCKKRFHGGKLYEKIFSGPIILNLIKLFHYVQRTNT